MEHQCTILHIEDNDADQILFERDLRKLAFQGQYLRAQSFELAKEMLEGAAADRASARPDLIVADSKLGLYNGLDIVRWIKDRPALRDIPVVVYSTAISPTQRSEVLHAGAAACLTKPMDSKETLVALDVILSYVDKRCREEKGTSGSP
jgi:CheY-like chemotaxis protein